MEETFKSVKGLSMYNIGNKGTIISLYSGKEMKPFKSKTSNYLMIKLITDEGKRRTFLLHRLVAQAFIDNPNDLPEVNHLDRNPYNCNASNLEWCTRRYNLEYSKVLENPVKNQVKCKLFDGEKLINKFNNIKEACKYAAQKYNISMQSLYKYHKIAGSDIHIEVEKHKKYSFKKTQRTSHKIPADLYVNGIYVKRFESIIKAKEYAKREYGVPENVRMYNNKWKNIEIKPSQHTQRKVYSNTANIRNKV